MYIKLMLALCGCFMSLSLLGQSTNISNALEQIEQNNKELLALKVQIESTREEMKGTNNLPDPQLGAYYLPWSNHPPGGYTEFQISQSMEFPTIYKARESLIDQEVTLLELNYKIRRQDVLAQAKGYCLNLIYLNKQLQAEATRTEQAKKVFDQITELFEKEQLSILDLNKAKIVWLQHRFKIQEIENSIANIRLALASLNGGIEISALFTEYESSVFVGDRDSLWAQRQDLDPVLISLQQKEAVSQEALSLARNQLLPDLTAGYNHQGVNGAYYSGIYAGISIPLWSNQHMIKAARSQVDFQESYTNSRSLELRTQFDNEFNDYQMLLSKFQEYDTTLADLHGDKLLFEAYQLGQISYLEYYMELQFYQQAYDAMLEMQHQLYIKQTELLKYQL